MITREYPALITSQIEGGAILLAFAAPAMEIETWGGIPQKKGSGQSGETTGFQRDEDEKRIKALVRFMNDERNIIQNPLLCATQSQSPEAVQFFPHPLPTTERSWLGTVRIQVEDYTTESMLSLLQRVKQQLQLRVPELASHSVNPVLVTDLKRLINATSMEDEPSLEDDDDNDDGGDTPENDSTLDSTEVVFSDESHILDFWHELAARVEVLQEVGQSFVGDSFAGFTRDAMIAFLKPIVVMDGQHRLRGAIEGAKRKANTSFQAEIAARIESGEDPGLVQDAIQLQCSRWLPVSLLLSNDAAEHVFQFVVVNQKATPIGKALLGTIVSTTLSNEELSRVSDRLNAADIRLEQSRAVAYLSRNPNSPFKDKVESGVVGESSDRLAWSVMASLVKIFQRLQDGKLFGKKPDWSDKWRRDCLEDSQLVADYSEKGFETPYEYWSSMDGPWRGVFISFFEKIQQEFSSSDPESHHYWGSPKKSNLFNKISLTILAADFFQFLVERQYNLDLLSDVGVKVDDWLPPEVSRDYFNRDWKLRLTKKDSVDIREKWATLWEDYRKDPQRMPKATEYSKGQR